MSEINKPDQEHPGLKANSGNYFAHCRIDVLNYVPNTAARILSVGCGAGATEAALISRGVHVVGIEKNPQAANEARSRGVEVFNIDANDAPGALGDADFDCFIFADVLEHLVDPASLLIRLAPRLKRAGTVIISIPNFRKISVIWQLAVLGHIHYEDAGVLDRTHLRITTRKMCVEWLKDAGVSLTLSEYRISRRRYRALSVCCLGFIDDFLAEQILVVGQKN